MEEMRENWASKYKDLEDITTLPIFYIWNFGQSGFIRTILASPPLGIFFKLKPVLSLIQSYSKSKKYQADPPLLNLDFTHANRFFDDASMGNPGMRERGAYLRSSNHLNKLEGLFSVWTGEVFKQLC